MFLTATKPNEEALPIQNQPAPFQKQHSCQWREWQYAAGI
jgi:hypothetical protein